MCLTCATEAETVAGTGKGALLVRRGAGLRRDGVGREAGAEGRPAHRWIWSCGAAVSCVSDHLIMTWSGLKVCYLTSVLLLPLLCVAVSASKCEVARTKCAYRAGCGMALQNYMIDCAALIVGHSTICSAACERALIALLSTEEGEALVECDCDASEFCETIRQRLQVCRHQVLNATAVGSVVSCQTARSICNADLPCSTALVYFYDRCRHVFQGRACDVFCKNSLQILYRQEKADKLKTCFCDGGEDFACRRIRQTTEELCNRDIANHIRVLASSSPSAHPATLSLIILLTTAADLSARL